MREYSGRSLTIVDIVTALWSSLSPVETLHSTDFDRIKRCAIMRTAESGVRRSWPRIARKRWRVWSLCSENVTADSARVWARLVESQEFLVSLLIALSEF